MNNQAEFDIGAIVAPCAESTTITTQSNSISQMIFRGNAEKEGEKNDSDWDESSDEEMDPRASLQTSPSNRRTNDESDCEDNAAPSKKRPLKRAPQPNEQMEERMHSADKPNWADGDDEKIREVEPMLRSPTCVFLGHPNAGKTSIQDAIRGSNVQAREANGITQSNAATNITIEYVQQRTELLRKEFPNFTLDIQGLVLIDTPGHNCFSSSRCRGTSMCDVAVLVVNIMEDLQPIAIDCLKLLKDSGKPFVVAVNQIDRLNGWVPGEADVPFRAKLRSQNKLARKHFRHRVEQLQLQFSSEGFNTSLYYKNKKGRDVSLVPVSAMSEEGISDLLMVIARTAQKFLKNELELSLLEEDFECSILDVKQQKGFGTTMDVILRNGVLRSNDTIVVCGMNGPIEAPIRHLLIAEEGFEQQRQQKFEQVEEVFGCTWLRIVANDLEKAVVGSSVLCVTNVTREDREKVKDEVQSQLTRLWSKMKFSSKGICVQSSTLGTLEALVDCVQDLNVPMSSMNVSNVVSVNDVRKASAMRERGCPEYAVIVALDVRISEEVERLAAEAGVRVFCGDLIHRLCDEFAEHMEATMTGITEVGRQAAVFPCELEIDSNFIIRRRNPVIVGCLVRRGSLRRGTPLVAQKSEEVKDYVYLGRAATIRDSGGRDVEVAQSGEKVSVGIVDVEGGRLVSYGTHFDDRNVLVSLVTRESINAMKEHFRDHLVDENGRGTDDLKLLRKLKHFCGVV